MNIVVLSVSSITVQVSLSNMVLYPLSQNWLILRRLCLSPSRYHTLLIEINELPIVPVPTIFPHWFPPNPTIPPSFMTKSFNICLSPVICREQLFFRYQYWCFGIPMQHTSSSSSSSESELGSSPEDAVTTRPRLASSLLSLECVSWSSIS